LQDQRQEKKNSEGGADKGNGRKATIRRVDHTNLQ